MLSHTLVKRPPRQSRRLLSFPRIHFASRRTRSLPKRSHLTYIPIEVFITHNLGFVLLVDTGGYTDLGDAQGTEVFRGWGSFIFHVFCCLIHTGLWLGHERGETGEELKGQVAKGCYRFLLRLWKNVLFNRHYRLIRYLVRAGHKCSNISLKRRVHLGRCHWGKHWIRQSRFLQLACHIIS